MSAELPERIGVVGGGRMGAGIAHAFLVAGCEVVVAERDAAAAEAARERVMGSVATSTARGAVDETAEALSARLRTVDALDELSDRELVVEAVFEDLRVKLDTLVGVERVLDERAVLASNTSSLSLTELAAALHRPARFVGLHFFNPVPASTLVEVVLAPETGEDVRSAAPEWVRALGKTPIVVNDSPGFASSRLGVAIALEAMRMVEEGVASAQDIDLAMELGYRHPAGPLRTTDIVGLDVRLGIAEYLHETLGERFAPPDVLREKVARGELGRKSGTGFYDWS
ncbi:3-hydroxyacyl-CoA dehydrogenase family protein [Pseudoclavibacter chungangensis]|uniref:3-hydroxyacyl-CoA dehydrogenase family protein n=1 Tax=Pseudoclavibacter chungangensis TaxID=587635 RepID=A0A7J5C088_9MICO|nr:3-hydroxyacyl-CoA dehydrogenase family protein [Pseudoclavibacter chungangensis]KAB1660144.1 3-hydroxyacyl-CoA dehydrogenase family protein [Pseudoclavibacter chungangensis]NYJ66748.1 3-hydroxybutyryl-CoA dehydrogenase [Pseudoclavibacter chungangensis]